MVKDMKRIVPVITLIAIMLCLAKNVEVRASDITNNYDILALQPGIELTSIIDAYERLTTQQQLIAEYLVGSFNNIYLTARGFKYNIPYDQGNLQAQFSALGSKVFDFITTRIGWKSRVNETFRQYLSGVIIYASQQSKTFANWFQGQVNGTDRQIFIPYSEDAFDAWTTFYNDPSGDGIASFGDAVSEWESGIYYDFAFTGVPWGDDASSQLYNNFILNYSPVLYSSSSPWPDGAGQFIVGDLPVVPYTLYVLRSNVQSFRFGYINDFGGLEKLTNINYKGILIRNVNGRLYTNNDNINSYYYWNVYNSGKSTLKETILYAFDMSPINKNTSTGNYRIDFTGAYPLIEHVFLVDNLDSLSNPEEVLNEESLNIVSPDNSNFIIAPNGRLILPSWPGAPDDPLGFWDLIVDESLNEEGDDVTDDDYHNSIVNNNVINNYYVSDDVKINVPVDWFENPYTDQLNTDAQDFIVFAKDCVDCLGDFDIYMYGAIVIGLAGGIVKKLLL